MFSVMYHSVLCLSDIHTKNVQHVNVDPLLTVGTEQRVPHVGNMDDRQTAVTGQHWMGVKPIKIY